MVNNAFLIYKMKIGVFKRLKFKSVFEKILISSVMASCNVQQFDCLIIITVITISSRDIFSNLQIFAHELKIFIFYFFVF